ncbi:MAG TPA: 2-amino-4-hydroxy-6-hydroxymethyldihydropteridine diphosphokinase [Planctomycetaceae bacterium]|nr:2-amino-4-hydroxy-6-hydroxymethyldihydropteridine diphosphokinase [Planctomycetaceae bacterium]
MPRCHISLGGNVGPVAETFDQALERLENAPGNSLIALSAYHRTAPVGAQAGEPFLNAAAEFETRLAPLELLDLMQSIERDLGRIRTAHWGPRTLDLDLLFYGQEIIKLDRLIVPHPAAWYRRFVLDPLVEIAPHLVHPEKQVEIQGLRERLLVRPMRLAFAGGTANDKLKLIKTLAPQFPIVDFSDWEMRTRRPGQFVPEPTLICWLGAAVNSGAAGFEALPLVSRLNVPKNAHPAAYVQNLLKSALGTGSG